VDGDRRDAGAASRRPISASWRPSSRRADGRPTRPIWSARRWSRLSTRRGAWATTIWAPSTCCSVCWPSPTGRRARPGRPWRRPPGRSGAHHRADRHQSRASLGSAPCRPAPEALVGDRPLACQVVGPPLHEHRARSARAGRRHRQPGRRDSARPRARPAQRCVTSSPGCSASSPNGCVPAAGAGDCAAPPSAEQPGSCSRRGTTPLAAVRPQLLGRLSDMSPRAACRLDTLGFEQLYDYMPGRSTG
jgi:hypothetical protein